LRVNTIAGYITGMAVNTETTVRKLVSLSREMVEQIQDYRFTNRVPSESEAIRRLIEAGLKVAALKKR
jgi:hypothetical protein